MDVVDRTQVQASGGLVHNQHLTCIVDLPGQYHLLLIAARQSNAPARSLQKGTTGPGAPTYFKRLEGCSGVMLRPGVSIGPHDPHHSGQQGGHSHDLIQHDNSTPFLLCHYLTPPPSILSMDAPPILLPALPSPVVHFFVFSTNSKTDTILLHFMLIFR